jgi:branched-chain amino acid transport system permease protein
VALLKRDLLKPRNLSLIVLLGFLCGLPFLITGYRLEVVVGLLINIILVVSFRLIATTGNFSFAHAALAGAGAYTAALMAKNLGLPFGLILPAGGCVAALVGLILSYPLVRLRGFYFFIGSFAAGEAVRLSWVRFKNPFGGAAGLYNIPLPDLPGMNTTGVPFYFLVLVVTVICVAILYRIDRSRMGDVFKSIAGDESLAASIGININRYKIIAFVIGSFFAGIAGVLMAYRFSTVDPHQFDVALALNFLVWAVVGGINTFTGPIIGVVVLGLIEESIRVTFAEWMPLIYGAILIVSVLFLPDGLTSVPGKISARFKRRAKVPTA